MYALMCCSTNLTQLMSTMEIFTTSLIKLLVGESMLIYWLTRACEYCSTILCYILKGPYGPLHFISRVPSG